MSALQPAQICEDAPERGSDRASIAYSRRWWILAVLVASEFVVELDATVVNVALPRIAGSLHAGTTKLQWIVDAYILVFATLTLFFGTVSDRIGRRRALLAGLTVLLAGSVGAFRATGTGQLIAMRAMMGLGGALIMPATLSILVNVFRPGELGKAFVIWSTVAGLSFAIGPLLGGWLVQSGGWSEIFLINVPILLCTFVATVRLVPVSRPVRGQPLDLVGAGLSVVGLGLVVYALIAAPRYGWGSGRTLELLAAGAVTLGCLVGWESRRTSPAYDLRLLRNPEVGGAVVTVALAYVALGGALFVVSQYLQFVLRFSPLGVGVRLMPMAIAYAAATPLSVITTRRLGARVSVAFGLATVSAALALLAAVCGGFRYELVLACLMLAGAGLGLAFAPTTELVLQALPRSRSGEGSALQTTALTIGGALGVALLGSVLSSGRVSATERATRLAHHTVAAPMSAAHDGSSSLSAIYGAAPQAFAHGAAHAFLVGAGVTAVGATLAVRLLPSRRAVS